MKKVWAIFVASLVISAGAFADTIWNNSYAYVWDGTADTWYDLNGADQSDNFDGADLGVFEPGYTLFLNAQINASANGGDVFSDFSLNYRVDGGSWVNDSVDSLNNVFGDYWQGVAGGNDLSGLAGGTHTIELYLSRSHSWVGGAYTTYLNTTGDIGGGVVPADVAPTGDFFTATFQVVPEPGSIALFGMGIVGLMVARRRLA